MSIAVKRRVLEKFQDPYNCWVYDIAKNREGKIVALFFHLPDHPDCMDDHEGHNLLPLMHEGLSISCSKGYFKTLEEAKKSAWRHKAEFSQELD